MQGSSGLTQKPIEWVENDEALARLCERWRSAPMLALDTEFMRSTTYYPVPALVQVGDGATSYLIDPLVIDDFSPFNSLLIASDTIKVLHSCSEDLEVFHRLFGVLPNNIFDTQIAAALVGYGFSMGYGKLVAAMQGVTLPKGETRSDWLQRPLTPSQIGYAALDVEYLYSIAEQLISKLNEFDRFDWMVEESNLLIKNFAVNAKAENAYMRAKSAWKLPMIGQAILRELYTWREKTARERNLPRNRILTESALYELADRKPTHLSQLRNIEGLSERRIKNEGQRILDVIDRARNLPDSEWPQEALRPLNTEQKKIVKSARAGVEQVAEKLSVAPEVLVRKKEYENLARQCADVSDISLTLPHVLSGWRKSVIEQYYLKEV